MLYLRVEMQDLLPAEVFFCELSTAELQGFNAHHGRLVLIVQVSLQRRHLDFLRKTIHQYLHQTL